MVQTSILCDSLWPETYEDIETLYNKYIYEDEKDTDVFTHNNLKNGRSYYFYGQKVFEFIPSQEGKSSKLRILEYLVNPEEQDHIKLTTLKRNTDLMPILEALKRLKQNIFRNTITETFACCNDFYKCSDARECIHQDDRFYNGCYYRKNLEAGRIFFGVNQNV